MANNKIQVKRTNVTGRTANVTSAGNAQYIDAGEFALNMADGILYTSNGSALIAVGANNTTISSGNSTVNLFANSTFLRIANSSTSSNLTSSSLIAGISTVNTTVIAVGSNNFMNATALDIGNTIITTTNAVFGGTIAANGSIGSAGQVLTSSAAGNVYWSTVTSGGSGTVTSVASGNGITGGPITTTGTLTAVAGAGVAVNTSGINVLANTGIVANSTGTFVNASYIATITANNATFINGNTVLTVMESLRANRNLHGGGTITVDGSGYVLWSARYIVISNGRGTHFSTEGFFNISCPTSGTITGVGGAANKTATAAGIPLGAWEALYYILPIGSTSGSLAANFRVVSYTSDVEIPSDWLLICAQNGDNSNYYFNNGIILKAGQSFVGATFTSANMPQANNANNLGGKAEAALNVNSAIYANSSITNTFTVGTGTYFVANGNVGIGTNLPATKLNVNPKVSDDNTIAYDSNTVYFTHQTPTSTTTLNDPKPVLLLARQGTGGQAYGAAAEFNLSRYENSGVNSRTRLDIRLADGNFLTNNTNVLTLLSNGNVGIGNSSPSAPFTIQKAGSASTIITKFVTEITGTAGSLFDYEHYNSVDGNGSAQIRFNKANGTVAAPTIVGTDRATGRFGSRGYDGTAFYDNALIRMAVDGAPGTGSMPGRLEFWTTPSGSTTLVERMRITSTGNVGISNTAPADKFSVNGTSYFGANVTLTAALIANGGAGSAGQVLHSNGTATYWAAAAGGGYYKGGSAAVGSLAVGGQNLFRVNANTLNTSTTFVAGENAQATGPIAVASGITLTIQSGARVSIV